MYVLTIAGLPVRASQKKADIYRAFLAFAMKNLTSNQMPSERTVMNWLAKPGHKAPSGLTSEDGSPILAIFSNLNECKEEEESQ